MLKYLHQKNENSWHQALVVVVFELWSWIINKLVPTPSPYSLRPNPAALLRKSIKFNAAYKYNFLIFGIIDKNISDFSFSFTHAARNYI